MRSHLKRLNTTHLPANYGAVDRDLYAEAYKELARAREAEYKAACGRDIYHADGETEAFDRGVWATLRALGIPTTGYDALSETESRTCWICDFNELNTPESIRRGTCGECQIREDIWQ